MVSMLIKYRGLARAVANMYQGWIIEDIQEASRGFYPEPVYGSWESTKNYLDTRKQIGFANLAGEEPPLSDDDIDDEHVDEGSDREESDEVDEAHRGGVAVCQASYISYPPCAFCVDV